MKKLLFGLLIVALLIPVSGCVEKATDTPELEPFTSEAMGISGVVPKGWNEATPGLYARGDMATDRTAIVQQAAPGTTASQITAALLPQLDIEELPESVGSYESAAFTWDLYTIEVEAPSVTLMVDVALAETDAATYLILLQAVPDEYDVLHEEVFMPAIDALVPLEQEGEEACYEDPNGRFSVPIPTSWTVEQAEGYGILTSPDGGLTVYVMAVEAESVEEGTRAAWAVIDPTFDLEPDEVIQEPVTNGAEEAVTITYDTEDDDEIVIAGGWLYEGIAYIEIFRGDLITLQKRMYQLSIISTGYDIYALEE
ncbi:MAG: hypothetical protein E3J66_02010, partial [Dehalococcoidia bacterium]